MSEPPLEPGAPVNVEVTNPAAIVPTVPPEPSPSAEVINNSTVPSASSPSSTSLPPPSPGLARRVLKQVEFYFSDSNLPKDLFLKGLYDADLDHWVDLSVIASFKRMRELGPHAAADALPALLASSTALRLSADGTKLTRVTPLPSVVNADPMTVFTKGWPLTSTTIDSISAFFAQQMGSDSAVRSVRLRREGKEKTFEGTAWVEFADVETAEKVVAGSPYTYTGEQKERVEGEQPTAEAPAEITVVMKAIALHQLKDPRGTKRKLDGAAAQPSPAEADGKTADGEAEGEAEPEVDPDADRHFTPDLLVRFDTVNTEATTRESLRALVESVGCDVAFLDYSKGEASAVVRLGEGSAVKAAEAVKKLKEEGKELDGVKAEMRAMEGEEESVYWRALWKQMREVKEKRASEKRGGRGRGRGGRGGWGGKGGRGRGGGGRGGRGGGRGNKKQRT